MLKAIIIGAMLSSMVLAGPTEVREWRSTAGTRIEASATTVENGQVSLKAANGRVFAVPLEQFVEEDRKFLAEHFEIVAPEPGQPVTSGQKLVAEGLAFPLGEVSGPIDAGEGSHYFVYLPKTLREGRKAPLMFVTLAGGATANTAKMYAESAEISGWIVAGSVESKNGPTHPEINHDHTKRCVADLLAKLPIDEDRVFFTGGSGGGAMSFYNAVRIKSAGNMPLIGYSPDKKYDKKQYCYAIGGTRDYNRYVTAHAVAQYGDRGFHRLHPGGHDGGPKWIGDEGILWLGGRYLGDRRKDSGLDLERLDYEAGVIGWIRKLKDPHPHRAHYWCQFLQEEYKIHGPNAAIVADLFKELNSEPNNSRYTLGLAAINKFSNDHFADEGAPGGALYSHTTPRIEAAAEKLAAEYAGVPLIDEIAQDIGSPTVK